MFNNLMSNIMTPHNLEMFLKKVVLESGGTITLISNNLRIHLVKQGETVKQKAMTTGCSLEDSIWIEGKSLRNMTCFEPGHQGSHRLHKLGFSHTAR